VSRGGKTEALSGETLTLPTIPGEMIRITR
jgi:hypothetical protein